MHSRIFCSFALLLMELVGEDRWPIRTSSEIPAFPPKHTISSQPASQPTQIKFCGLRAPARRRRAGRTSSFGLTTPVPRADAFRPAAAAALTTPTSSLTYFPFPPSFLPSLSLSLSNRCTYTKAATASQDDGEACAGRVLGAAKQHDNNDDDHDGDDGDQDRDERRRDN